MTTAAEPSDIELVERVITGKTGAFEAFYRRYSRLIQATVRKRLGPHYPRADSDDLVSDFFVKCADDQFRFLRMWQRGSSLGIYLAVSVRNFVSDYKRKSFRADTFKEDPNLADWVKDRFWTPSPADGREVYELRRVMTRACRQIKQSRSRILLRLKLLKQLPNDAIAYKVQMTEGAARTAISRAKSDLLTELRRLVPEYFPDVV